MRKDPRSLFQLANKVALVNGARKGIGIYSVSKAAIINLTRAIAQDWGGDNIRVNAICPGLIKTSFSEALWNDESSHERFMKKGSAGAHR